MYDDLYNKLKKTNEFITKEQIYALYDQVSKEIESGKKDNGVWTKAYADARGDLQTAKGIYIELMVERHMLAREAEEEVMMQKKEIKEREEKEISESIEYFTADRLKADEEAKKAGRMFKPFAFLLVIIGVLFLLSNLS